ncbi:MAG: acetoacetate--CoA ligase, partial [Rhodoluna sp.]
MSLIEDFQRAAQPFSGGDSAQLLHKWSVENMADFWKFAWDKLGIIGEKGEISYQDTVLPQSSFFPDARVSYVENLLAHQNEVVIVSESDLSNGGKVHSHEDLVAGVARMLSYLEHAGVDENDAVVSILPIGFEVLAFVLAGFDAGALIAGASPEFGESALNSRFEQLKPKVLVAAPKYQWNGKAFDRSETISNVLRAIPSIKYLLIVGERGDFSASGASAGESVEITHWGDYEAKKSPKFIRRPFDHPAYVLFTSGTTGVPKGLIHRSGGVLLKHAVEQKLHCDIRPGDRVCFYTTTGWMMWNWSISILGTGADLILFDGSPNFPDVLRLFHFAEKQRLTHLGLSARLLDVIRESGRALKEVGPLENLRTIMVTGSPLSATTAQWVLDQFDGDISLAPFSGGTDIAGSFIGPYPNLPFHPGQMQGALLGMDVDVLDDLGNSSGIDHMGELVCKKPFPSVPLGIWGDRDKSRFTSTYFHTWPGVWVHGDLASKTEFGGVIIHGRSDATLNISGVRIGTGEIYSALDDVSEISGALAIAQPWNGDARIVLFLISKDHSESFSLEIKKLIRNQTSARHVPAAIFFVSDLPLTFSGKLDEIAVADHARG